MVRVFLKGGVWKNSEDEVLKAAVQKYGKQQWARVASLLNRKTAKQAKARWHEWLDPSIRKTEWSRAEEEKLLHLAKLMPAQWKTIAPLVGRTATQCQEHYEMLLDQAVSGGDDSAAGASASANEELRRQSGALRAGQIDSHPETKAARPDPIDMDEDELEMLQEARARLANTMGKKAKRKQREKVLAQAKRLADLQKRRELKQAGLLSKAALQKSKKRKNEIDLGVEIPFHKPAPAGFHDTSSEAARAEGIRQKRLTQVDYQKLNESRYKSRDHEEAQRKKKEEKRLRFLELENEKYAKQKEQVVEVTTSSRPRGVLHLPEPTMTDSELGQLAKMQQAQVETQMLKTAPLGSNNSATQALLGDYSDRPLPTPMRTPALLAAAGRRDLVREASQLRMLERGQTPLLGGPDQHHEDEHITTSTTEQYDKLAAAATPQLPDRAIAGRTPGGGSVVAPRDHLQLNRPLTTATLPTGDDSASVGASTFASSKYSSIRDLARQERLAAKRARKELENALAALPAPQFEYELAAPADVEMEDAIRVETVSEADQEDVEAAEREQLRKEAEKIYEARSSVLKRKDLPRPAKVLPSSLVSLPNDSEAHRLIQKEFLTLLQRDAHAHPVPPRDEIDDGSSRKKKKRKHQQEEASLMEEVPPEVPLDYIAEESLKSAKEAIETELDSVMSIKVAAVLNSKKASSHDGAMALLSDMCRQSSSQGAEGLVFVKDGWVEAKSNQDTLLSSLRLEFETLKGATEALRKKNDKQEAKLGVVNGGYEKRSDKCGQDMLQSFADLQNTRIEQTVYRMLQTQELRGGANRLERLKDEVRSLRATEASLQKEYGDLIVEKRRVLLKTKDSK